MHNFDWMERLVAVVETIESHVHTDKDGNPVMTAEEANEFFQAVIALIAIIKE